MHTPTRYIVLLSASFSFGSERKTLDLSKLPQVESFRGVLQEGNEKPYHFQTSEQVVNIPAKARLKALQSKKKLSNIWLPYDQEVIEELEYQAHRMSTEVKRERILGDLIGEEKPIDFNEIEQEIQKAGQVEAIEQNEDESEEKIETPINWQLTFLAGLNLGIEDLTSHAGEGEFSGDSPVGGTKIQAAYHRWNSDSHWYLDYLVNVHNYITTATDEVSREEKINKVPRMVSHLVWGYGLLGDFRHHFGGLSLGVGVEAQLIPTLEMATDEELKEKRFWGTIFQVQYQLLFFKVHHIHFNYSMTPITSGVKGLLINKLLLNYTKYVTKNFLFTFSFESRKTHIKIEGNCGQDCQEVETKDTFNLASLGLGLAI